MTSYYCRLCLTNCIPEESLIFSQNITDMLQFCMPEIDVKLVNNPIICRNCKNSLSESAAFKTKCLSIQENIKKCHGFVDLGSIKVTSEIMTPQSITESPNSSTFDNSFKKFLTSTTLQVDSTDHEVSKIMSKAKEDLRKCDEFLDLLESSNNIRNVPKPPVVISKPIDTSAVSTSTQAPKPTNPPVTHPLDVALEKNKCIPCHKRFPTNEKLITHLYTQHQKSNELRVCLLCRYKTKHLSDLRKHFRRFHRGCVSIMGSCLLCTSNKPNYRSLFQHMRANHKNVCSVDKFRCNSCQFTSRNFQTFKRHYLTNHDLTCNYCLKQFESTTLMNRHLRIHSNNSQSKAKDNEPVDPLSLVEIKIENGND